MRICFAFGDAWRFGDAPSSSDWHQSSVLPSKATQPTKEASFLVKHFFLHWSQLDYLELCKFHLMIIVCFANAYFDLKSKKDNMKKKIWILPPLPSCQAINVFPPWQVQYHAWLVSLDPFFWHWWNEHGLQMKWKWNAKKLRTEPLGAENASFTNLAREREAGVGSTECVQLSPCASSSAPSPRPPVGGVGVSGQVTRFFFLGRSCFRRGW